MVVLSLGARGKAICSRQPLCLSADEAGVQPFHPATASNAPIYNAPNSLDKGLPLDRDRQNNSHYNHPHASPRGFQLEIQYFPADFGMKSADPLQFPTVVNVTGAGDSGVGAMVAALIRGLDTEAAVAAGIRASLRSLECREAVSPRLSPLDMGWV